MNIQQLKELISKLETADIKTEHLRLSIPHKDCVVHKKIDPLSVVEKSVWGEEVVFWHI